MVTKRVDTKVSVKPWSLGELNWGSFASKIRGRVPSHRANATRENSLCESYVYVIWFDYRCRNPQR